MPRVYTLRDTGEATSPSLHERVQGLLKSARGLEISSEEPGTVMVRDFNRRPDLGQTLRSNEGGLKYRLTGAIND